MTETRVERSPGRFDYVTPLASPVELDWEVATTVVRWFNHTTRDWVVMLADSDGRQVGDSTYVSTKGEALTEVQRLVTLVTPDLR